MKPWPVVVVLVGLILASGIYILVHEPERRARTRAGRELPRLPVDRVEAPVPPRFAGPLPSRVEGFRQELEEGPPLSHVRFRLLEGHREMGEKFLAALRQTAASARSLEELGSTHGVALGLGKGKPDDMRYLKEFQHKGVPCAWLRERLSAPGEEDVLVSELLWRKLVRCPGGETEAVFAREDAPVTRVLDQHYLFGQQRFTPALENAVRHILAANQQELFRGAVAAVSASQEPMARELIEALWRQADGQVAAELEEWAAGMEVAKRKEQEHPLKCPSIPTQPEGLDQLKLNRCLERWASINWAATARLAIPLSELPELWDGTQEDLATLRNFPSIAAMEAWARERKLLPGSTSTPAEDPENLNLKVMMEEAGRAFMINIVEHDFPRRHDELLVTLAWKVHPDLAGVVFEQLPPKTPHWEPSNEEYTLRAYMDGQRFSVQARSATSVHDIEAVVGLLNQLLEARGSTARLAVLDEDFHQVTVVLGPEASLREADALGLWRLGDGREVLPKWRHGWSGRYDRSWA